MNNFFKIILDENIKYDIKNLGELIKHAFKLNVGIKIDELTEKQIISFDNFEIQINNETNELIILNNFFRTNEYGKYISSKNSKLIKCIEQWSKNEYNKVKNIRIAAEKENIKIDLLKKEEELKNEYDHFVRRTPKYSDTTSIFWSIYKKTLKVNVLGRPIFLLTFLKLILRETKLSNYSYKRVSPFKIYRNYEDELKTHHFIIEFLDAKNEYKKELQEILEIKSSSMQMSGEYSIFIPDLLELCVYKGLLKRQKHSYDIAKRLDDSADYYREDIEKVRIEDLENEGFIIPNGFNLKKLNNIKKINSETVEPITDKEIL